MQPNGRKTNMNSSSDSNGRKRRIVSGSSSVKKTSDRPVSTNGPVGKKDAYQGRKIQFQKKTESTQQSSAQNTAQNTLFQAASQQNQNQQAINSLVADISTLQRLNLTSLANGEIDAKSAVELNKSLNTALQSVVRLGLL